MKQIKRVWVVGAGAVGSALAALLYKGQKAEAFLVGASPHWEQVRAKGLRFEAVGQPEEVLPLATRAWDELPALGEEDLVLLAGKATDLPVVAQKLSPKLGPEATVVALQNGLGMRDLVGRLLGRPAEAGVVYFGARSAEAGRSTYFNVGRLELSSPEIAATLAELFPYEYLRCWEVADYRKSEWGKLAINCLANPLAGLLQANNNGLISPVLDPAKQLLLDEVKAVARAEGVEVELTVEAFNKALRGDNIPSMRTDIDRGRASEIDFINGAIVELAAKHGLAAPANQLVTSLIKYLTS